MRQRRIKIPPEEGSSAYHCVTRTVNGEWLFDNASKETLRKHIWQVADFCGVEILTYAILSNHFHVLVGIPQHEPVTDDELLRRYAVLHPQRTREQAARTETIRVQLKNGGPEADAWRRQQLALMGDVSQFMKLLKQRFSIWFNKRHRRFGTLWAERFKSVLVEQCGNALRTMAAYIDLNPVRAGLVQDPKDYRFCGYAEAVAGNRHAQEGISRILGDGDWKLVQVQYRELLFGTGAGPRERGASISRADLERVLHEGGSLPPATILRCRLRFLTDGAILGSRAFVDQQFATLRERFVAQPRNGARDSTILTHFGDLATLRGFKHVFTS